MTLLLRHVCAGMQRLYHSMFRRVRVVIPLNIEQRYRVSQKVLSATIRHYVVNVDFFYNRRAELSNIYFADISWNK